MRYTVGKVTCTKCKRVVAGTKKVLPSPYAINGVLDEVVVPGYHKVNGVRCSGVLIPTKIIPPPVHIKVPTKAELTKALDHHAKKFAAEKQKAIELASDRDEMLTTQRPCRICSSMLIARYRQHRRDRAVYGPKGHTPQPAPCVGVHCSNCGLEYNPGVLGL